MNGLVLQIGCDEPETEMGRVRRAVAFLERCEAGRDIFPDPSIEENPIAATYYTIEARAEIQRKATQKQ